MKKQSLTPSVPAAKAWKDMQRILDKELPVNNANPNGKKRTSTILLLLLLISGCGIYNLLQNGQVSQNEMALLDKSNDNKTLPAANENRKTPNKNLITINNARNDASILPKKAIRIPVVKTLVTKNYSATAPTKNALLPTAKQHASKYDLGENSLKFNSNFAQPSPTLMPENQSKMPLTSSTKINANERSDGGNIASNKTNDSNTKQIKPFNKDSTKSIAQNTKPGKSAVVTLPKNKVSRPFHVGMEWMVPVAFNNKSIFTEVNGKSRPLLFLIPSLWLSKALSKKSSLQLNVNPYAQYLLNSRATFQTNNYTIGAISATNINQPNNPINLAQSFTLNKITGLQVGMQFNYKISNKWTASIGINKTWAKTALINEKLIANKAAVIKDSVFGIINSDKDWAYINKSFATGKVSVAYQFKQMQVGLSFIKPITAIYISTEKNAPINTQLFLRYSLW